jgi:hypothetical protein
MIDRVAWLRILMQLGWLSGNDNNVTSKRNTWVENFKEMLQKIGNFAQSNSSGYLKTVMSSTFFDAIFEIVTTNYIRNSIRRFRNITVVAQCSTTWTTLLGLHWATKFYLLFVFRLCYTLFDRALHCEYGFACCCYCTRHVFQKMAGVCLVVVPTAF